MAQVCSVPPRLWLSGLCFLLQSLSIIFFATFVRYSPERSPNLCPQQLNCSWRNQDLASQPPRLRDLHLQALLGLGLLLPFLGRYGPGSVASSILLVAFALQWAALLQGCFHSLLNGKILVGAQSLVSADFCTAAVLIAAGALLGRLNPIQRLLLTLLGVFLFSLNEYILLSLLGVTDSGGSLTVHTFGASFGLMVSRILHQPRVGKRKGQQDAGQQDPGQQDAGQQDAGQQDPGQQDPGQQDAGQQAEVFTALGTFYLWLFWPSFASATSSSSSASAQPWAVLNACFALAASTVGTFVLSPLLCEGTALGMVQLQDASLASMAMMGMAGELLLTPFGALAAGFLAGLVPPLGFRFLTPLLSSKLKMQDPCGVLNVHWVPGVLGALLGTLLTLLATADAYGGRLESVLPLVAQGSRTVAKQALCQLCALPLTLLLAVLGGCITGVILKIRGLRTPPATLSQENSILWEVAEEGGEQRAAGHKPSISTLV